MRYVFPLAFGISRCDVSAVRSLRHPRHTPRHIPLQSANDLVRLQLLDNIQKSAYSTDVAEGFTVVPGIAGKGKGLIATRDFQRNEEVLRERAFVALQSLENKKEVLACANCFRFVGASSALSKF